MHAEGLRRRRWWCGKREVSALPAVQEERDDGGEVQEREYFDWIDKMWDDCKHI